VGHVDVDKRVVAQHLALGHGDKAHATHVGGQLVDLVEGAIFKRKRRPAVLRLPQV